MAIQTGFPFKSRNYSDDPSDPKLLRGDNVAQGQVRWEGVKRWPKAETSGVEQYWLQEGDVILAMDRPWIEAGLKYCVINREDLPCLLVQRVARLRGKEQLDNGFLRYVIGSQSFTEYVLAVQTGTAVPHISTKQIQSYRLDLPPLSEQRAIAATLGVLDDKIDLNRRMNETLEAMARAIFKDWFVDFRPVRVKASGGQQYLSDDLWRLFPSTLAGDGEPEHWRRDQLLNHTKLISGGTPKSDVGAYWGGAIAWASAKDVSQCSGVFLLDTERKITERGLIESATRLIPRLSTVVVARGATTGRFRIIGREMAMNQTCYALHSTKARPFWLCLAFAHLVNDLVHAAHGSVFDTITTKTIEGADVVIADDPVMDAFESTVAPLFHRVLSNLEESSTLAELRDCLLPKLLSGELQIRAAEKVVASAL